MPAAPPAPAGDTTGSAKPPLDITAVSTPPAPAAAHAPNLADKLPASIGGPALRTAGAAGNPAAEYEIGVRFAEGRGVPANTELAVQWLERAANQGLAPAQYRLGSLYEKGQGVKKDLEKARTLYLAAADKGNAKAVHNLAVLYAEGIDGKPDYRTAAQWFRKAAERGVADSQYNLGILYARGIGVDQNLAESYKWFSLAAAQGDQDSAKKRDDVTGRLDQQSLVAARLAVQTWVAEPAPDEAMTVKAPANGWDGAPAAAPAKPAARRKPQSS
jgi:localization factor PodJL